MRIETIGNDLNAAMSTIMKDGEFTGGELKSISRRFHSRVEDHRLELLSPVIRKNGNTINVVRHNGIEEIGHRWSRMHTRRRTGRSQTAKEMGMFGALTAVLSNMENRYYIDRVLSRIHSLREFSSITKDELNKAKKLIRPIPRESIIRRDENRKHVLTAFVKILETNEDLLEETVKVWVKSTNI